jgi:hypothetical protein
LLVGWNFAPGVTSNKMPRLGGEEESEEIHRNVGWFEWKGVLIADLVVGALGSLRVRERGGYERGCEL